MKRIFEIDPAEMAKVRNIYDMGYLKKMARKGRARITDQELIENGKTLVKCYLGSESEMRKNPVSERWTVYYVKK